MKENIAEKSEFQSTHLFILIWRWKTHIAIVCIIAIIASIVFSGPFFIKPRFKSTIVLYPPVSNSISGLLMTEIQVKGMDATQFGEDEKTEQLLQMLNSQELKRRVIERFNLMSHYGIDSSTKYMKDKLYGSYDDNIRVKRTEFMAVEVAVSDVDPVLAAQIANGIVGILDTLKHDIQKQRTEPAFKIVETELERLGNEIRNYEDSLNKVNKLGIINIELQTERLTEQYGIAVRQNDRRGAENLKKELNVLEENGAFYDQVTSALWKERTQYYILKRKYEQARVDSENILPASFVVESAESPSETPSGWCAARRTDRATRPSPTA